MEVRLKLSSMLKRWRNSVGNTPPPNPSVSSLPQTGGLGPALEATRESFGKAILALGKHNPAIVVLDADLSVSTRSQLFADAFPERFFQMGIAEANMIGTAAGLAFAGKIPFACSFGCFLTGRFETIRISVGYSQANVKLVGTHAGLGIGEDGATQMALEDIGLMRLIPGMTVLQPSDATTTRACVELSTQIKGPVYLRLTRQKLPLLYPELPASFGLGKGIVLREGAQIALLATGATVAECVQAREHLNPRPWVIDFPTLEPIDGDLIRSLARTCQWLVTVEDHFVAGGLGSAVASVLAGETSQCRLHTIGVTHYGESASAEALYEAYGLSARRIVGTVNEVCLTSGG